MAARRLGPTRRASGERGPTVTDQPTMAHAGVAAAEALIRHGVDTLFTLSGGHLFSLYDGCVQRGIRLVDTRHEHDGRWTAPFAAPFAAPSDDRHRSGEPTRRIDNRQSVVAEVYQQ